MESLRHPASPIPQHDDCDYYLVNKGSTEPGKIYGDVPLLAFFEFYQKNLYLFCNINYINLHEGHCNV